jgi:hypothetical protein
MGRLSATVYLTANLQLSMEEIENNSNMHPLSARAEGAVSICTPLGEAGLCFSPLEKAHELKKDKRNITSQDKCDEKGNKKNQQTAHPLLFSKHTYCWAKQMK